MRRILVDFARDRQYLKRGAGALHVSLGEAAAFTGCPSASLVVLDEALTTLTAMDRRKGQVVEMRFFGGLSVEEVAEVLKVSDETVMRDWRHGPFYDPPAVTAHFFSSACRQLLRRNSMMTEEPVDTLRINISRAVVVQRQHLAAITRQEQRRRKTGRARTNHDAIEKIVIHL